MSMMVIDDDQDYLDYLRVCLNKENIKADFFTSSEEALKNHQNNYYSVVLTDIMMPDMDGFELVKKIKSIHPTSLIIVMTSHNSMDQMVQAFDCGACDYFLKKPEAFENLVSEVKHSFLKVQRWKKTLMNKI